jgi:hypothetical protein
MHKIFRNKNLTDKFIKLNFDLIWYNQNTFYVHYKDCLNVLNFCLQNNIGVLGIDGVIVNNGDVDFDLSEIYDASTITNLKWEDFIDKSITGAQNFISDNKKKNGFFEFVFIEMEEYTTHKPGRGQKLV